MRDITPEFSFIEDHKTQLKDIEKRMYREKMNALKELVEKLYKENSDCGMHHNQNVVQIISPHYEIQESADISEQLKLVSKMFSVPIEQLDKTVKRFLAEAKPDKKKKVNNLIKESEDLFEVWKKSQKDKKKISSDVIDELMKDSEEVSGIKIVTGITSSDATAVAGAIVKDGNFVVHIFDGNRLVSMASENVDIDLRQIAPEIGKMLGGSGGGTAKMTQCGGPKKDNIENALKTARTLTKKQLE